MNSLKYKLNLMLAHKDAARTRVPFLFARMMRQVQRRTPVLAQRLKDKEVVEVAFMLSIPGMWKLDYLFKEMQQDPRYHPYVVIVPYSVYKGFSEEEVWRTVRRTEEFVKQRGFEYIIPYDEAHSRWTDFKKTYRPDIVFFTAPYRDALPQYYIYHFKDCLTCYVSYAFNVLNVYGMFYHIPTVNLFNFYFAETALHKEYMQQYGRNGGPLTYATGYPGTEVYLRDDYTPKEVWKPQPTAKKRVIWAPHHTIGNSPDDSFSASTFLTNCDLMVQLAQRYSDTIQFAFKPHQLLKFKLIDLWGAERTEQYYNQWAEMPNCQLEESGYVDLFFGSDAMMHDSGSFTTEYLFLNKPVMFLQRQAKVDDIFNTFGEEAWRQHYHGSTEEDMVRFLEDVVLAGNDPMHDQRQQFFDQYLKPIDGVLPSRQILNILESTMNGENK